MYPVNKVLRVITRTWTVEDACGNAAASQDQIITVIDDQKPVWTFTPPDFTVVCGESTEPGVGSNPPAPTAEDECSTTVRIVYHDTYASPDEPCSDITRTWTVTDPAGNSNTFTQTITRTLLAVFKKSDVIGTVETVGCVDCGSNLSRKLCDFVDREYCE